MTRTQTRPQIDCTDPAEKIDYTQMPAYQQGADAWDAGKREDDCPHPKGGENPNRIAWFNGYFARRIGFVLRDVFKRLRITWPVLLLAVCAAAEPYDVLNVPPPPVAEAEQDPPSLSEATPEADLPPLPEDAPRSPAVPAEKPLSAASAPAVIPARRRMYYYKAAWCGPCVPQGATIEQFARDNGLTIGIYTGPPKANDADILLVDVDKFPSKAGINSIPAIRVVEATEVGRLVGLSTAEQIGELWARGRANAVGLSGGTLPVKQFVDMLLKAVGQGPVEVTEGVTVSLAGHIAIDAKRSGASLEVVLSPPATVQIRRLGLRYTASLNGASVYADKIVLKLGGLPDVTFSVE